MEVKVVLSLFDGISCGRQALNRIGIKPKKYYASEIDKHAIKVTQHNYPDTIQLGSVVDVDVKKLDKIDLLIGGSPCTDFSFAGKRTGMSTKDSIEILTLEHYLELKSQGFEFEGQSYLFWEYMRILTDIRKYNPDVKFLLENVMMGAKWQKVLTKAIGINPIEINSALVSAQNRRRLYFTNIGAEADGLFGDLVCKIPQPKDKGILLKDILESEVDEKYFLSGAGIDRIMSYNNADRSLDTTGKGLCLAAGYHKQGRDNQLVVHNMMPRSSTSGKGGTGQMTRNDGKTYCLDTGQTNAVEIVAMRGRNPENPSDRTTGAPTEQRLEARGDGKTNCITTVQKDNLVKLNTRQKANYKNDEEKSNTFLSTSYKGSQANGMTLVGQSRIRRLTPIEVCRLQTIDDNYFKDENGNFVVSETQVYKAVGNGWTVDVISHIFNYLK